MRTIEDIERARRSNRILELQLRTGPKGYSHGWIKEGEAADLSEAKKALDAAGKTVKEHLAKTQEHRSAVKADKHPPHHADKAVSHAKQAGKAAGAAANAAMTIMNHPKASAEDKKTAATKLDKAQTSARLATLEAHNAKTYGNNAYSIGFNPKTGQLSVAKSREDETPMDTRDTNIWYGEGERLDYRAMMSSAEQNDLPDSDFAYIQPGGDKDSEGKTTPRSLRHFNIHDAAHVRNALARVPTSPFGDKALPAIKAAAKKLGIDVSEKS